MHTCQSYRSGNPLKSACTGNYDMQAFVPPAAIEDLKAQVIRINHMLEQLCNRIHPDSFTMFSYSPTAVYTSIKLGAVPEPPSYAAAVPNDLISAVKSAVAKFIREQKATDRNQNCIAIHGMRQYDCDLSNV